MKTNLFDRYIEWFFNHIIMGVTTLFIGLLMFYGGIILSHTIVTKQLNRWSGWMYANRVDYVPDIHDNFDQCIGSSKNYAYIVCEEPPTFYKKWWVWKHY